MNMLNRVVSNKIVVCPKCTGTGYTLTPRTRESHGEKVTCNGCNGLRVVRHVVREKYEQIENQQVQDD